MIRFFFRSIAVILLAVAVIFAVLDATRSIAESTLVTTPLAESWQAGMPELLAWTQSAAESYLHPLFWDPVMTFILSLPGTVVFAGLSLVFYAIGHRPARRFGRIAVEN